MSVISTYLPRDIDCVLARKDFSRMAFEPDPKCSYSLCRDFNIKAVGGFVQEREGVFTLWGMCEADITRSEWALVAKKTRELIAHLFSAGAVRVQAYCRADHPAHLRFLNGLGLDDTAHLRRYGPDGVDFYLAAKVRNG